MDTSPKPPRATGKLAAAALSKNTAVVDTNETAAGRIMMIGESSKAQIVADGLLADEILKKKRPKERKALAS